MSPGGRQSCIEETTYVLCFGGLFYRKPQKLVGNNKIPTRGASVEKERGTI
jgi:hypothetical protein